MFSLPNSKLKAQVGQINHICSYFQHFGSFYKVGGSGGGRVGECWFDLVLSFMTLVLVVVACSIAVLLCQAGGGIHTCARLLLGGYCSL